MAKERVSRTTTKSTNGVTRPTGMSLSSRPVGSRVFLSMRSIVMKRDRRQRTGLVGHWSGIATTNLLCKRTNTMTVRRLVI